MTSVSHITAESLFFFFFFYKPSAELACLWSQKILSEDFFSTDERGKCPELYDISGQCPLFRLSRRRESKVVVRWSSSAKKKKIKKKKSTVTQARTRRARAFQPKDAPTQNKQREFQDVTSAISRRQRDPPAGSA